MADRERSAPAAPMRNQSQRLRRGDAFQLRARADPSRRLHPAARRAAERRETDQIILQASANARSFLGLDRDPVGLALRDLEGDLWRRAQEIPGDPDLIPYVARCRLADGLRPFNALLHRAAGGEVVVELKDAGPPVDVSGEIESALQTITNASSLAELAATSARIFKSIAGYDRVMIYRFDDEGHGEVFAETRRPELEAFLGNRYPASDIPQIARKLYVKNCVRLLGDVDAAPSPITPRISPLTGSDLDMSLCYLRSASPIHIQYLRNMGVSATLVVSLMVGESCGASSPVTIIRRAACSSNCAPSANCSARRSARESPPWKVLRADNVNLPRGGSSIACSKTSRARETGAGRCSTPRARCCCR